MNPNNERVRFGTTDLMVSRLCQGTAFRHLERSADEPQAQAVLHHCLDQGVNFFDSASAYGWGGAERALGKAIAGRRDEVVICTKVPAMHEPGADGKSAPAVFSRAYLTAQVEGSLQRLGTDFIDLYLLHQPDKMTPPEEIIPVMEDLVEAGKVRYWGVSNHSAEQIGRYLELGRNSAHPIVGLEDYYNIAGQSVDPQGRIRTAVYEETVFPLIEKAELGLLAFSPMDTGYLAPGRALEADSPLRPLIAVLDEVAGELGAPRAAVCLAWVLSHRAVTSVLAGSEAPEHVDANLAGTRLHLPAPAQARLDAARQAYLAAQSRPS
ncbi:MAG: hypothetical protein GKR89_00060 [Candidatus Latescibacteria bacterium]|nr:hypothetical protein [Candidatus Latescibacterota bacterium]